MSKAPKPRHSDIADIEQPEFKQRYQQLFLDPAFDPHREQIETLAQIAWEAHVDGRKAPITQPAGPGFKDPSYPLADDWRKTHRAIGEAQRRYADPDEAARILVISASDRNDKSCPGEVSKSRRLLNLACETLAQEVDLRVDTLDLSLMTSEYGRVIHPCKGCVSTAMPLCHWPCSCYPNYSLGQVNDWMQEIYPLWVAASAVLIITPVYWYQAPSALKLMIDRLVCADGGNPDPSSTQGKDAQIAKQIELDGWEYPRHLEGRLFGVIVHGDAAGVDQLRMNLSSWLKDMQMIPAGLFSELSRFIGYYEPYALSHEALDKDKALQQEVQQTAAGLAKAVRAKHAGQLESLMPDFKEPRPK